MKLSKLKRVLERLIHQADAKVFQGESIAEFERRMRVIDGLMAQHSWRIEDERVRWAVRDGQHRRKQKGARLSSGHSTEA